MEEQRRELKNQKTDEEILARFRSHRDQMLEAFRGLNHDQKYEEYGDLNALMSETYHK